MEAPRGISDVAVSPNGHFLAAACDDNNVYLVDLFLNDASAVEVLQGGHSNYVYACAFNPASTLLASVCLDSDLVIWNLQSSTFAYIDIYINCLLFACVFLRVCMCREN